jgi:hypothetical protein
VARRGGSAWALVATGLLAASVLTGCTGGNGGEPAASRHTPTTSPTTAYPTGAPTGTVLTDPGSELAFGAPATITWHPKQNLVGTLRISVDKVARTTFKQSFQDWRVDATMKTYTPYFVHARVTNLGPSGLGGVPVPLYGESAADALVEPAVFKETFKPCNPSVLPTPFASGASAQVCLVYLVPDKGALTGAAFRPTQEFEPIVWKGAVATAPAKAKRHS